MSLLLELLGTFAVSYGMLVLIQRHAHTLGLVDEPNHRSVHKEPTPRGGGAAFVPTALLGLLFLVGDSLPSSAWVTGALALVWGVGILDDRHDAPPRFKFVVIFLATLLLWKTGIVIDNVGRYFGVEIRLGWLALPFTYFAVAGFTNAMNLVDGIDALAGTLALIILSGFAWLGWRHGDPLLWYPSLFFMAALLAFLLRNRPPASIFMGDSGSLTLGFLIALLAIRSLEYLPSVSALYLGAVPILDTLVVMLRRKRAGRSAMDPDSCHFHHLLLKATGKISLTVGIMVSAQVLFLLVALSLERETDQTAALAVFLLGLYGLYRFALYLIDSLDAVCYRR